MKVMNNVSHVLILVLMLLFTIFISIKLADPLKRMTSIAFSE